MSSRGPLEAEASDLERAEPRDRALDATAIVVSAIPGLGGPIAEVIEKIPRERQKRQIRFLEELGRAIDRIRDQLDTDFIRSDAFATLTEEVLEKAARRKEIEKRNACANALANAARGRWSNDDDGWRLVDALELLRPQHLRSLALIAATTVGPHAYGSPFPSSTDQVLRERYADIDLDAFKRDWADLERRGLVSAYPMVLQTRPGAENVAAHLTPLGQRLVAFVSAQ
jgi:hypothetical protein